MRSGPNALSPTSIAIANFDDSQLTAADLNGDGHPDLVTLDVGDPRVQDVSVVLWKKVVAGFPEFEPGIEYTAAPRPSKVRDVTDPISQELLCEAAGGRAWRVPEMPGCEASEICSEGSMIRAVSGTRAAWAVCSLPLQRRLCGR